MPTLETDGASLYYELHGEGEPLVLAHGSWADATTWTLALPALAESFRVLIYDRRGHSRSTSANERDSVHDDCDDLALLIESLERGAAHVATNSSGGNIALRLAARRPELFRSLSCHEPPLLSVLPEAPDGGPIEEVAGRIAAGDREGAAQQFVDEVALGPGTWERELTPEVRAMFVQNASTFPGELQDPDFFAVEYLPELASRDVPLRFTEGSESPPLFSPILDRVCDALSDARRETIEGAGHVPQLTQPGQYADLLAHAIQGAG